MANVSSLSKSISEATLLPCLPRRAYIAEVPTSMPAHDRRWCRDRADHLFLHRSTASRRLPHRAESPVARHNRRAGRSEEHTSELQSLMRISYAVFCFNKKNHNQNPTTLH